KGLSNGSEMEPRFPHGEMGPLQQFEKDPDERLAGLVHKWLDVPCYTKVNVPKTYTVAHIGEDRDEVLDMTPEEELRRLREAFSELQMIPVYNAPFGPNSGTYIRQLIKVAGFTPPSLPEDKVPGWNYSGQYRYGGPVYDTFGRRTI